MDEEIKTFERDVFNPRRARWLGLRIDWQSKPGDRERTYHSAGRKIELTVGRRGNRWQAGRSVWSENTLLILACPWIAIYWRIGPGKEPPAGEMGVSWGVSVFEGDLVFEWGKRSKRFHLNPFCWHGYKRERLRLDGEWDATEPWTTEGEKIQWYEEQHPYAVVSVPRYMPQYHEGPKVVISEWHATATCRVERTTRTRKWLPWRKCIEYFVDFKLDCEVGRGSGSWKGGTIGFSEEMLHGDDVADVVGRACAKGRGR